MAAKKKDAGAGEDKTRKLPLDQEYFRAEASEFAAIAATLRRIADEMKIHNIATISVVGRNMADYGKSHIRKFLLNAQKELT